MCFRHIIGAHQYLSFMRQDICFTINQACQFMHAPTDFYCIAVKHIMHYL